MHAAAIQLAPVLAAEKSRVAFYIAAGCLALWAVGISVGIGLRRPDFPGNESGQRVVIGVSAVLVALTLTTAILTASSPTKAGTAAAATTPSTGTATGGLTTLAIAANPTGQLSYDKKTLTAPAGRVNIVMTNMAPLGHNITVSKGSSVLGATPTFQGGTKTLSLRLKPGTYTFYCSVPGHRQAGMVGTLTIS